MATTKKETPEWYRDFFHRYWLRFFVDRKTNESVQQEVAFVRRVLQLPRGAAILDLACGTGRHAVALARAGFQVTGLDLEPVLLSCARTFARKHQTIVHWVRGDMRRLRFDQVFDAIINLFSSFGYFQTERENDRVLREVAHALKPGGVFLLDLPNKEWFLTKVRPRRDYSIGDVRILEERRFNSRKRQYTNTITISENGKKLQRIRTTMRLYEPQEITRKLNVASFRVRRMYGNYDGAKFHRTTSPRLIIVAMKH